MWPNRIKYTMDKLESEEVISYKRWLVKELNKVIKKIELAHLSPGDNKITKDFVYAEDILHVIYGHEYSDYKPPLKEHDVISRYFDNIEIMTDKKMKKTVIKCWNILDYKTTVAYNFYEIIINTDEKAVLVLGRIKDKPYEYKYHYKDLYHLERIFKETFIQNCLYAKHDKQPDLKIKGAIKNVKS